MPTVDDLPTRPPASGGDERARPAPGGDDHAGPAPGGGEPAGPSRPPRALSDPPVAGPLSAGGPVSNAPLSGRVVGGRWRVLDLLGRGGMGSVYEAQNTAIGKRVALKFIEGQADAEAIARFQREAEVASAVDSAHIVQIFDTGTTDEGQPYIVMELLRGESLGSRLRRLGRLSLGESIHVVGQVLRGLHRAHAAGVIHRDLKPDNIYLVDRDDDPLFAKILDFGISKITRPTPDAPGPGTITRQGTVLGTPFYMSPEQAQAIGDLDARSDLFSVGVILYECLVGQAPWASLASYEAVIVALCTRDAPDVRASVPEVPAALAAVVKRALARDRDRRFESASAMLEALRAAAPGLLSARDAASSAPSFAPVAPPSSWTPSESLGHARTEVQAASVPTPLPAPAAAPASPRRWPIAVAATALAFTGTWLALPRHPVDPPLAASARVAPPEQAMRIETSPPDATVTVDGKPADDRTVRGPALSSHEVLIEAPGHSPLRQTELLNGRTVLRVALRPTALAPATAAATASAGPASAEPAPPTTSTAPPPTTTGPATTRPVGVTPTGSTPAGRPSAAAPASSAPATVGSSKLKIKDRM